jgi:signal transduction histidine kinase
VRSPALSLGRRFAGLVAVLVAVPAVVQVAIFVHVAAMNEDADRLVEETRESALASRLVVRVESLASFLESGEAARTDAQLLRIAASQLEQSRRAIESLSFESDEEDPSREEHQLAEERLSVAIEAGLDAVEAWLSGAPGVQLAEVETLLERGLRHASVLANETYEESQHAGADVERRARAMFGYTLSALIVVLLVSVAVSLLVRRLVLRPIRELQAGAERLRSGHLDHRIAIRNRDEIGALAGAFNDMADEIGKSHAELERKIEARTLELVRAARLADVGVLAAGVAHEINNPLASIASCGEGLLRKMDRGSAEPEEAREYLGTIVSEAYRTRDITRRLLDLARPAPSTTAAIDAAPLFEQVRALTHHLLEQRRMRIEIDVEPSLGSVEGDAGELLQVLLNLVINARDAGSDGGVVRLRARDDGEAQLWEVEDDGDGIADEDLERVFDPFFTTKGPGVGTGLGLSLAAAIVDRHGGGITASRGPHGGALFTIRFADAARQSEVTP